MGRPRRARHARSAARRGHARQGRTTPARRVLRRKADVRAQNGARATGHAPAPETIARAGRQGHAPRALPLLPLPKGETPVAENVYRTLYTSCCWILFERDPSEWV